MSEAELVSESVSPVEEQKGPKEGFFRVIQGGLVELGSVKDHSGEHQPNFEEVDQTIENRAAEFYGVSVLEPSRNRQFRLFKKMLDKVDVLDYPTRQWRHSFRTNVQGYVDLGKNNLSSAVMDGKKRIRSIKDVYSVPEVRDAIWNSLRELNDPTVHILEKLREWPSRQAQQVPDRFITLAENTFDQILFSVHGDTLLPILKNVALKEVAESTPEQE